MDKYSTKNLEGKMILFATILASGMAFLDGTVVNIAIPTIQNNFNASLAGIQWIVNGYALMLSSLILISGALGDRFGRKKIFLYGIIFFVLSSFLCGIAGSINQLILFRFLQGVGAAMMVPGSLSIINVSFEESVRGRAIGLWSGFSGGVAAIGPFLGGVLVQTLGWPSIFFINIFIGLLALFITIKFVPETKSDEKRKLDLFGTGTVFLGLLGITYGLITGADTNWTNPPVIFSLLLGVIFLALFIISEKKVSSPLVPFKIFRSPLIIGANLATLFLYFALSGVIFFLVLNLQQVQNFEPIVAGAALLPTILIITFLSGYGGSIADKIGPRKPMIIGSLIVALGMGSFMFAGSNSNYFIYFLPGLILFGLGMSFVIAPLTKSALSVNSQFSGAASGVNNAVARVAGLLAVALLGAIVLFVFSIRFSQKVNSLPLSQSQKNQLISQENRLGAVVIPENFNQEKKTLAQKAVEESFVSGFRWVIGTCAFLAFLSSVISYRLVNPKKKI